MAKGSVVRIVLLLLLLLLFSFSLYNNLLAYHFWHKGRRENDSKAFCPDKTTIKKKKKYFI
ncbi:MAG: hypothetical protein N7Q72_03765, partial [Spiroplasma sp. Tabriz.8]|nr:hypothetical protein [Spiroplasma sp. Tabriz.8]